MCPVLCPHSVPAHTIQDQVEGLGSIEKGVEIRRSSSLMVWSCLGRQIVYDCQARGRRFETDHPLHKNFLIGSSYSLPLGTGTRGNEIASRWFAKWAGPGSQVDLFGVRSRWYRAGFESDFPSATFADPIDGIQRNADEIFTSSSAYRDDNPWRSKFGRRQLLSAKSTTVCGYVSSSMMSLQRSTHPSQMKTAGPGSACAPDLDFCRRMNRPVYPRRKFSKV